MEPEKEKVPTPSAVRRCVVNLWQGAHFLVTGMITQFEDWFVYKRPKAYWTAMLHDCVSGPAREIVTEGKECWAVVTGGNAGLGYHTALHLAKAGLNVVIACRCKERALKAVEELTKELNEGEAGRNSKSQFAFIECDLVSLEKVKTFTIELQRHLDTRGGVLKVIVANAGIMAAPFSLSAENYNMQCAVNFFSHALIVERMLPTLKRDGPSRIVMLTSAASQSGVFDKADFLPQDQSAEATYNKYQGYFNSKAYCAEYTRVLSERLAGWNKEHPDKAITANAVHPGCIATSIVNTLWYCTPWTMPLIRNFLPNTPDEGGAFSAWPALSEKYSGVTGKYRHMASEIAFPFSWSAAETEMFADATQKVVLPYLG